MKAKQPWPGLIFWLGAGFFRTVGYFALMLSGVCIARRDGLGIFLFELLVAHLLICTSETIDQIKTK